jgi:hypothetical protein
MPETLCERAKSAVGSSRARAASLVRFGRMLDSWLPFLIYGFFALAIPSSMVAMSFVFATRPA